jgi:predicted ester cyclase
METHIVSSVAGVEHRLLQPGKQHFSERTVKDMLFRIAFPDLHSTLEDLIAEGEKVAVRFTFTGAQQGALLGNAPTGKQVRVTAILITRLVTGKFVEGWITYDGLGMLQQLGVIPSMR